MKIKQSFIDRCGEITVKQISEIARIGYISPETVFNTIHFGYTGEYTYTVLKAVANVLKIDLSDIYEVEQLPNTLTE